MSTTPQPLAVENLHLLVHPGFGALHRNNVKTVDERLFERYRINALAMSRRDLLVAILMFPTGKGPYKPTERFVSEKIIDLKAELQKRMVVVSNGIPILAQDTVKTMLQLMKVREVAEARGYDITPGTKLQAYGESLGACVAYGASVAQSVFNLKGKAKIPVHFTNTGIRPDESLSAQAARFSEIRNELAEPYGNIQYDWTVPEND